MTVDIARRIDWRSDISSFMPAADGLVRVAGYDPTGRAPEEAVIIEKATEFGAYAVFFEAGDAGRNGPAQAFVFVSDGPEIDTNFAETHRRLWSWGGVPILYRRTRGVVQLFRCGHQPDFVSEGKLVCKPYDTLRIGAEISAGEAWWDTERLRNGTLWDDPKTASMLLSGDQSAHRRLVNAVKDLYGRLETSGLLSAHLRRRLLILSLLIAYLDERQALPAGFFSKFLDGTSTLPDVLANGTALLAMFDELTTLFNGDVFSLDVHERAEIAESRELAGYSRLIEAREESSGQINLWALYSFRDLPVEVISHIYELFVEDPATSVYTPPALVRLILDEALGETRLDRILDQGEFLLDPACGSGVFLVEAYKKIVLHWRSRNNWARPDINFLRMLATRMLGIDKEKGAIELASFSLCLAMCDALTPEEIRATSELFPKLRGFSLIQDCFLAAKEHRSLPNIGAIVGNPPFESKLKTGGSQRAAARYRELYRTLPDNQVAYLFLHEALELLAPGGVLGMLQQYNLLYNQNSSGVRQRLFSRWNVREILDFVSVRGLFKADTKVVAVVAQAEPPPQGSSTLHAVFRRSARAGANQHFDIDFYDLHWLCADALKEDNSPDPWRADLLGGSRTYAFVKRLRCLPTLGDHARERGWNFGEGFIEGRRGKSGRTDHLIGKPLLPSRALTLHGIDEGMITVVEDKPIEGPRSAGRFTSPMLLIREHAELPFVLWDGPYLTYKNKIVGFAAKNSDELTPVAELLLRESVALRAYAAAISIRMFSQKATTLSAKDIYDLPFDPQSESLSLSENERKVAKDILDHYFEYVRLGNESALANSDGGAALKDFVQTFVDQVSAFYPKKPLKSIGHARWAGTICQGFVFGDGEVNWAADNPGRELIDSLLRQHKGTSLAMTRIARLYHESFIFLLKPDRLRYWLPTTALRDGDDTLADLRSQGF